MKKNIIRIVVVIFCVTVLVSVISSQNLTNQNNVEYAGVPPVKVPPVPPPDQR